MALKVRDADIAIPATYLTSEIAIAAINQCASAPGIHVIRVIPPGGIARAPDKKWGGEILGEHIDGILDQMGEGSLVVANWNIQRASRRYNE